MASAMSVTVKTARRFYGEELRFSAHVASRPVVNAFATVPRERSQKYAARFVCPAGFIEFNGARDPAVAERLATAFRRDRGVSVKSLRRAPAEPDETSWLAGEGWWLSTAGLED
jgi:hypothetical protein